MKSSFSMVPDLSVSGQLRGIGFYEFLLLLKNDLMRLTKKSLKHVGELRETELWDTHLKFRKIKFNLDFLTNFWHSTESVLWHLSLTFAAVYVKAFLSGKDLRNSHEIPTCCVLDGFDEQTKFDQENLPRLSLSLCSLQDPIRINLIPSGFLLNRSRLFRYEKETTQRERFSPRSYSQAVTKRRSGISDSTDTQSQPSVQPLGSEWFFWNLKKSPVFGRFKLCFCIWPLSKLVELKKLNSCNHQI